MHYKPDICIDDAEIARSPGDRSSLVYRIADRHRAHGRHHFGG